MWALIFYCAVSFEILNFHRYDLKMVFQMVTALVTTEYQPYGDTVFCIMHYKPESSLFIT